jgi:hypothetical protein
MFTLTGDEGELVSSSDAQELIQPFQKREKKSKSQKKNPVHAEFFGINVFRKLIDDCGEGCVGFRVYYGTRSEDHSGIQPVIGSGKNTSRLVIVPVDSKGNDILKDERPVERGLVSAKKAMVGGPVCPPMCGS